MAMEKVIHTDKSCLTTEQFEDVLERAKSLQAAIEDLYAKRVFVNESAEGVWRYFGKRPLLTSVRRSMTNLFNSGLLVKDGTEMGMYNVTIQKYRLSSIEKEIKF